MSNDYVNVLHYYDQGLEALRKGQTDLAKSMFKQCHELYQTADFPVFDAKLKAVGEDAFRRWRDLSGNMFDDFDWDNDDEFGH